MVLDNQWRKGTRSYQSGSCVEVRVVDSAVEVRHSKNLNGPVLRFNFAEWAAFTDGVMSREFELPTVSEGL